jgi:iron(III) transport system substrate-binding protein
MKRAALIGVALLLSACGGAAAPASSGSAPASGGPKATLDVEAAKRESALALTMHPDPQYESVVNLAQKALPQLKIQYNPMRPSDFVPRVLSEQRNGQYLWDVHVGPASNMLSVMTPADGLADIRPFVDGLDADVTADSKWAGGFKVFTDPDRPVTLVYQYFLTGGLYVNRDKLPASQFSSADQLLDPKFKGQIVIYDPTKENGGSLTLGALLVARGEDFVRKLMRDQAPVVVNTSRQGTEWLAEGRYPIGIGTDRNLLADMQAKGLGRSVELLRLDGQYVLTYGVSILKNAPHPNASKLFLNWLLGHDGQDAMAREVEGGSSRRLDVKVYHPDDTPDYHNLSQYKFIPVSPQGMEVMKKVLAITQTKA